MSQPAKTAKDVFLIALDADPADRAAVLDVECAEDAGLRRQVEALLKVHDEPDSVLDGPRIDLGISGIEIPDPSPTIGEPNSDKPGTQIGPYKLLQKLGEGGMGEVYLAEQTEPVERRLALKIIKAGMDTRQVIARFEAERQALAMMDHPNIAKVFDAGTTETGRPYFVMELVRGIPITQYCDEHRLDPRQRLALFQDVCHAVQHAHQKGIIHRDLKPSNVMVAEYDDRPVPKIIDFGVAKATQQRLTEMTMFTEVGTVVGTIEYMSPEQAKLNQLDIDTRSDVYSLGVLLYELLTGEMPFDRERLRSAALDEMLRIIREEEPSRPSAKLGTSESLASIASNRKTEPKRLSTLVRGELDWIVMKALEKERSRRYDTANAFADDIANYLNNEPVAACPPSPLYRFRKFARRNRSVLAATISTTALLIIVIASGIGVRMKVLKAVTEEQRMRIETVTAARHEILGRAYASDMLLASHAFERHDFEQTVQLLKRQCPMPGDPDLRDFGWYCLWEQCRSALEVPNQMLPIAVNSTKISPDEYWLAASGWGPGLVLVDLTQPYGNGNCIILEAERAVRSFAFSSDSKIIVASFDDCVCVWHVDRQHESGSGPAFSFVAESANQLSFSSDNTILSATSGDTITIWSLAQEPPTSGQVEESAVELHCESGSVLLSQFIRGTQTLLIVTQDGLVRKWDVSGLSPSGKGVECLNMERNPTRVTVTDDGRILAGQFSENEINVWNLESGEIVSQITPSTLVSRISLSPEGDMLASMHDEDRRVRVWNIATGRLQHVFWGHSQIDLSATFIRGSSENRLTLITGARDRRLRYWEISRSTPDIIQTVHGGRWTAVCAGPGDREFLLGNEQGELVSWEPSTEQTLTKICNCGSPIVSIAYSAGGQISIGMKDEIRLLDYQSGHVQVLGGHPGELYNLLYSPDGSKLVTAHRYSGKDSPEILFWDSATGEILGRCELQGIAGVQSFAFDREGRRLLTDSQTVNNVLRVFDASAGREGDLLRSVDLNDTVACRPGIAVSPDGKQLALACYAGVRLLDPNSLEETRVLTGHSDRVVSVAYSPNGKLLASAGGKQDGTLKLWDTTTFELKLSLPAIVPWQLHNLTFTRDGNSLAMLDQMQRITIWTAARPEDVEVTDW